MRLPIIHSPTEVNMAKFQKLLSARVKATGLVGVTFQLDSDTKYRVDEIAAALRRPAADIYRELVAASLPELEAEVVAELKKAKRS